jgi:hypothetical protein
MLRFDFVVYITLQGHSSRAGRDPPRASRAFSPPYGYECRRDLANPTFGRK